MIDKKRITSDLINLGIEKDDNIFLTIDIGSVGYFNKNKSTTFNDWKEIFSSLVGENGSVTLAAYTQGFFKYSNQKNIIFKRTLRSYAGAFPNYLIKDKNCIRSQHPTNSVIGFGNKLKKIFNNHNSNSLSYSIMGDLSDLPKSKHLMIGTIDKKNAPQSMHYVQEKLGFTKKHPLKGLFQIKYVEKDEVKIFTRKDLGGCSAGGYKLLPFLMLEGLVKSNYVGNAFSIVMPAKESIQAVSKLLSSNKKIIKCDNLNCIDCYGSFQYNGFKAIPFYIKFVLRKILKLAKG